MVASLQHKKEALEAKIRDKTSELRKLCIEEAELTGVLPSETPLEPGESPPQFRRRIGTSFTYPESLINKLKSKEDEAFATLELECKVQTGIAEAALGLANDGTASKSVRRKHRVLYEESQRRLSELESKLNTLRQTQPKQKKKPRPQTDIENDCVDGDTDNLSDHGRFSMLMSFSENGPEKNPGVMKSSHTFNGFNKTDQNFLPYRMTQSNLVVPNVDYRHSSVMVPDFHHQGLRSSNPSPNDMSDFGWWNKNRSNDISHNSSIRQSPLLMASPHEYYIESLVGSERFGSLDRNSQPGLQSLDHDNRISATLPRNVYMTQGNNTSILLPNQTYPENSLMRTQSLGSVDNSKHQQDRKTKEKEWYESSLDSSPSRVSSKIDSPSPQNEEKVLTYLSESNSSKMNQASINSIQFDTVVPYESPKNHTVVQAGKWQPYREVTKPFEMSDFYKYSTKFRKGQAQNQNNESTQSQQMKGIYKPLRPLECHPLATNSYDAVNFKVSPPINSTQTERYPNELISWYHDKNNHTKPRSSTLV